MNEAEFQPEQVSVLILAGGEGRRMQGLDKGLIMVDDSSLAEILITRFRNQCAELWLSCNRNLDSYQSLGVQLVSDHAPEGISSATDDSHIPNEERYQGPLAGIISVLGKITTPYLVVLPCDTPLIPATIPKQLYAALHAAKSPIVYIKTGAFSHYLHCIYDVTAIRESLETYFEHGNRAVKHWYEQEHAYALELADCEKQFLNINRPEDLQQWQNSAKS